MREYGSDPCIAHAAMLYCNQFLCCIALFLTSAAWDCLDIRFITLSASSLILLELASCWAEDSVVVVNCEDDKRDHEIYFKLPRLQDEKIRPLMKKCEV